ncbi:MAG: FAD-linked oxidase C-terminal domain-containing protein [Candidatus Methylomirabilota bacterium]
MPMTADTPHNAIPIALLGALREIVGPDGVVSDPDELRVYEADAFAFQHRGMPGLVVLPTSTPQVAEVVRLCARHGAAIVPRGAGTGLSCGATPRGGEVVVALTRMTRLLSLDAVSRTATVEAGYVNLWLTQAARPYGLFYAPDPASQQACTLGGNVAENAGGPHCLKYGTTTNHVLGLTVVLPSGEIVRLGDVVQDRPGYDLAGVFVGSEGTLGICTEVTVRLMPAPESVKTILAIFRTMEDASTAVSNIIGRGIIPVALEMIDRPTLQAVEASSHAGYPLDAGAVLLIELEGLRAEIEAEAAGVESICREAPCLSVQTAQSEAERIRLWKGRKEAAGAFSRISKHFYHEDTVVPRTKLPQVIAEIDAIAARNSVRVASVFHAGDGNLHPLICYDGDVAGQMESALRAGSEIIHYCIAAGGAVSGEHGIGLEKRDQLRLMFSPADLEAMQKVRRVFDPAGGMNPGKIFPDEERGAER